MNKNFLFLLLPLFLFCTKNPNNKEDSNLFPEEEQLLGVWQEVGPKIVYNDSQGNFIDSIDVNAVYHFKEDFSYTSHGDDITGAVEGTWGFDSTFSELNIIPVPLAIVSQSEHKWRILNFNDSTLEISHLYKLTLPDEHYFVAIIRTFEKI